MKSYIFLIVMITNSVVLFSQKWEMTIGFPTRDEEPFDVMEFYDKGLYIPSIYLTSNNIVYGWNLKNDINGNQLWDKILINPPAIGYFGVTSDAYGNIYTCGLTVLNQSCPILTKFNPCGEKEWCKIYYDPYYNIDGAGMDIVINSNNEVIILTYMQSEDQIDQIFLFCYSTDGDYLWKHSYLSKNDYPNLGNAAGYRLYAINDEYLICGFCYWPYPDDPDHYFLRPLFIGVDNAFNEKWVLPFAALDSIFGDAYAAVPLNDSVIMGVGKRRYYGNVDKSLLMFINMNGEELGFNQIENEQIGPDINSNFILDIAKINDSLFLASSNFGPDLQENPFGEFVIDTSGNIYKYQSRPNTTAETNLIRTSDSNFVISTTYQDNNGDWDIYLYKINQYLEMVPLDTNQYTYDSLCPEPVPSGTINLGDCDLITDIGEIPSPKEYYESIKKIPVTAYPNPASSEITLAFQNTDHHTNMQLECYNIYGQKVYIEKIYKGQQQTKLNINSWKNGLYIAVIKSNGKVAGKSRFVVN
jgi:hypothetical protein